jgi:hypothetical protein
VAAAFSLVTMEWRSIITFCYRLTAHRLTSCLASTRFKYSPSSSRIIRQRCSARSLFGLQRRTHKRRLLRVQESTSIGAPISVATMDTPGQFSLLPQSTPRFWSVSHHSRQARRPASSSAGAIPATIDCPLDTEYPSPPSSSPKTPLAAETADPEPAPRSADWLSQFKPYETVFSFVTGAAGLLVGVLQWVLTTLTLQEKSLAIVASLALSTALIAGFGALHNPPRFRIMALSSGIAILCLIALPVDMSARLDAISSHPSVNVTTPLVTPTPGVTSTPGVVSPTPIPVPVASGPAGPQPVWLTDLKAIEGAAGWNDGRPKTIADQSYDHSLEVTCKGQDKSAGYNLDHKYARFQATIGLPNDQLSDTGVYFTVSVDGEDVFNSQNSVHVGDVVPLDVSVADKQRILLTVYFTGSGPCGNMKAIWARARLLPS